MTDNTRKRGKADRSRINVNQSWERAYWTKALGTTQATLRKAVKEVGPIAANVRRWFIEKVKAAK